MGAEAIRAKKNANELAKQQLKNVWWLLEYQNTEITPIHAASLSIEMDFVDRLKVTVHDIVWVRLREKNTVTNSNLWQARVCARGRKEYIDQRAVDMSFDLKNASNVDINSAGISYPDDPNLSVYSWDIHEAAYAGTQPQASKKLAVDRGAHSRTLPQLSPDEIDEALEQGNDSQVNNLVDNFVENFMNNEEGNNDEYSDDGNNNDEASGNEDFCQEVHSQGLRIDTSRSDIGSQDISRTSDHQALSSSTPAPKKNPKAKKRLLAEDVERMSGRVSQPNVNASLISVLTELKETVKEMKDTVVEMKTTVASQKDATDEMSNTIREFKHHVSNLGARSYHEVHNFNNTMKALNSHVAKLGVLLPRNQTKDTTAQGTSYVPLTITKGHNKGFDLRKTEGSTSSQLWRNVARKLYTDDEHENIMLSPKKRENEPASEDDSPGQETVTMVHQSRTHVKTPADATRYRVRWSPVRLGLYKEYFKVMYGDEWLGQYELSKETVNGIANDVKRRKKLASEKKAQQEKLLAFRKLQQETLQRERASEESPGSSGEGTTLDANQ